MFKNNVNQLKINKTLIKDIKEDPYNQKLQCINYRSENSLQVML